MPAKNKIKPNNRLNTSLILVIIATVLVLIGIATLLFRKTGTEGIAGDQSAEQTIEVIKAHVSANSLTYSTSPYRYGHEPGNYMRPIQLPGYDFRVFPTQASLIKLDSGAADQAKIESYLGKGYTKKVLIDKTVQTAVEYDSQLVVCYLEIPNAARNLATIFGCADMLSYAQNAYKIKPFAELSRFVGGPDIAFDTPFTRTITKSAYQTAFLPSTGTSGLTRPSNLDAMQRFDLRSSNVAFYRSPSTNGWTLIGYGGFNTDEELCSSQYSQIADIQTALKDVCKLKR